MNTNDDARSALEALLDQAQSLQIATLDATGEPAISYAPFAQVDGAFYVFISQLAAHTQQIIDHPRISVMVIADEAETAQIFARLRVTYRADAQVVQPGDQSFEPALVALRARFGGMLEVLEGLPDFRLIQIKPVAGRLVMGFGAAYTLSGDGLTDFQHIGPEDLQK